MADNKTNGTSQVNAGTDGEKRPPSDGAAVEALAMAEQAEAEAAEAEALAAAARARAKAIRLRRQAEAAASAPAEIDEPEPDSEVTASEVLPAAGAEDSDEAPGTRRWRPGRRVWGWVALGLTCVLICALVAASAWTMWLHHKAAVQSHRTAEFAAAARQGVVSLMTMDFNHAKDDVQRVLDSSTGQFRDDFQSRADDFTKVVVDSKVVTKGSVNATAVQSVTDDSAVVLVAASSQVTNATGAQNEPRAWRLSVTVQRDGGQIKMSKVEFVP